MNQRLEIRNSTKCHESLPVFQRIQRFEGKNISNPTILASNTNSTKKFRTGLFQNELIGKNQSGISFESQIRSDDTNIVPPGCINFNISPSSLKPCIETDKADIFVANHRQSNIRSSNENQDVHDSNIIIGKTIPLPSIINNSTFNCREDLVHDTDLVCMSRESSGLYPKLLNSNPQPRNTPTLRNDLNHSSHPYINSQTKPFTRILPIDKVQSNFSTNPVSSQLEKSENLSFANKKAKNIYKPPTNRQTRYPVPSRSEHIQGSSTIRSFHQIKLKTSTLLDEPSAKAASTIQTDQNSKSVDNICDISLHTDKLRTSNQNVNTITDTMNATNIPKPTLGFKKLHSPSPIASTNRTKSQSRIFVPEKMDFSQLSSDIHLNPTLKGCKTIDLDCHYRQTKGQMQHRSEADIARSCGISNSIGNCGDIGGAICSTHSSHKTLSKQEDILKQNILANDRRSINIHSTSSHNPTLSKKLEHRKNITNICYEVSPVCKTNVSYRNEYNTRDIVISDNSNSICQAPNYFDSEIPVSIIPEVTVDPTIGNRELLASLITDRSVLTNSVDLHQSHVDYSQLSDPSNAMSLNDNTPLSFARNDLQNWIRHTIDVKDSVTAAYLISSHIFEKTSHSIAQRHALERKDIQHVINDYKSRLSLLLETNDNLLKKVNILAFENHDNCKSSLQHEIYHHPKVNRVISLPTRLSVLNSDFNIHPEHTAGIFSNSDNNCNFFQSCADSIGNISSPKCFTIVCPSPPPDLPEVTLKSIPHPPPNLPDIQDIELIKTVSNNTELSTCMFQTLRHNTKQSMMKPLHWKRLILPGRKNKHDIIWRSLPKPKIKSKEIALFEELFSKHKSRKNFKSVTNLNSHSTTVEEILPPNISRQLGVIFKNIESVDIHLEDIAEMLYSGDIKRSNITTSILEGLCKLVTDEWITLVNNYISQFPNVELSNESKTIKFFCDIPHVNMRFQHILYMQTFEEDIQHIHRNLDTINSCCSKLKNSHELRTLLSIILLLGNFMNQTYESFSEAVGFNLELLPRLKETKAGDNSCTFLDFVSRCYLLTFEHNISHGSIINILPFPDTGDLFIASKITLKELYEALSDLGKQLTKVREDTRHFLEDSTNVRSNTFVELVEKFFLFAERKIANEIELWKLGERAYQELVYYFYGELKDVWSHPETSNFFELWCNFASSFKESLLKEHESIVVKRRNDFNKADTKIVPLCPSGLKLKVKCRTGNKARFCHSSKPVKIH